jgi:hypothetical protein
VPNNKINSRILDKIDNLDESEEFKTILKDSLFFEKDSFSLGETEYTKKYDGFVARMKGDPK